jgi:hypothetical protein
MQYTHSSHTYICVYRYRRRRSVEIIKIIGYRLIADKVGTSYSMSPVYAANIEKVNFNVALLENKSNRSCKEISTFSSSYTIYG